MAISTAAVKAAYATEIDTISGTLQKARATLQLNRWIAALTSQMQLEENEIASYTIAGRTVTRRDMAMGQSTIDDMEATLQEMIYGSATLVDMNMQVAEPSGRSLS